MLISALLNMGDGNLRKALCVFFFGGRRQIDCTLFCDGVSVHTETIGRMLISALVNVGDGNLRERDAGRLAVAVLAHTHTHTPTHTHTHTHSLSPTHTHEIIANTIFAMI